MGLLDKLLNRFGYFKRTDEPTGKRADRLKDKKGQPLYVGLVPPGYGPARTGLSFTTLRNMSIMHQVSRWCINARKRQVAAFKWDIIPQEGFENKYSKETIETVRQFFKMPLPNLPFRSFINKLIEDLLVLDAGVIYKVRTPAGNLYGLDIYDGATIEPLVDKNGHIPAPPTPAYIQRIQGTKIAEFDASEIQYLMLNPRSYSVYGLSPLESLIASVSAALRVESLNLTQLNIANAPDGVFLLPEDTSETELKMMQELWSQHLEAARMGNATPLRFMRGGRGTGYVPFNRISDALWDKYNEWLFRMTCMAFDITPVELGYTEDINYASSLAQLEIGLKRGLRALLNFLEEAFGEIISQDLGYQGLSFSWLGAQFRDEQAESQIYERYIKAGVLSINEVRTKLGLAPLSTPLSLNPLSESPPKK